MSIDNVISTAVASAVKALYGLDVDPATIVPQATRKEFEGNLTIMVFPWVKAARKAPEAVGAEIGQWLVDNEPAVAAFNTVKGFLNIVITPTYWNSVLRSIEETEGYGTVAPAADSPLVMWNTLRPTPTSLCTWATCATSFSAAVSPTYSQHAVTAW